MLSKTTIDISDYVRPDYEVRNQRIDKIDGNFEYGFVELVSTVFGYAPSISLYASRTLEMDADDSKPVWTMSVSTGSQMRSDAVDSFGNQLGAAYELLNLLNEGKY